MLLAELSPRKTDFVDSIIPKQYSESAHRVSSVGLDDHDVLITTVAAAKSEICRVVRWLAQTSSTAKSNRWDRSWVERQSDSSALPFSR